MSHLGVAQDIQSVRGLQYLMNLFRIFLPSPFTSTFVAAHSRSLYGTAFLLTGNRDAAEDLVQETLTKLYPKWAAVTAAEVVN